MILCPGLYRTRSVILLFYVYFLIIINIVNVIVSQFILNSLSILFLPFFVWSVYVAVARLFGVCNMCPIYREST